MPEERTAYPHPDEFAIKRPEYHQQDDGLWRAVIDVTPYKVAGQSHTRAGARRRAIYEAQKTYHSYHSDYQVPNPYPEEFTDREGMQWERLPTMARSSKGDYSFTDEEGNEDYVDIETMLLWDVRPAETVEETEEEEDEFDLPGL